MLELTTAAYDASTLAEESGCIAVWGKGLTGPPAWKDAGCVHPALKGVTMPDTSVVPRATNVAEAYLLYNEYIVYDIAQVKLRYLFRVKMTEDYDD